MRRAVPAFVVTLIGLGALATFKSSPGASAKPASAATAHPVKPTDPVATAPPTTNDTPDTGTTPDTSSAPTTTPPTTTPTTTAGAVRTIDGDPYDNRYGTVQVRVTLRGNQITDVTSLQMPFGHRRSAEISQQAEPLLQQEVLQAQSAQIDIIGGATFTSESYAQSLQSALDKAAH